MRRECRERFPQHRLQRKPLVSNPGMHHGTSATHVPWCMSGSLTRGGRGKRSRHSRRLRNPQVYVSGKRPMQCIPETRYDLIYVRVFCVCVCVFVILHFIALLVRPFLIPPSTANTKFSHYIFWFVCLSVSNTTEKWMSGFHEIFRI